MCRAIFCVIAFAGLVLAAPMASAQQGKVQVGLTAPLLSYTSATLGRSVGNVTIEQDQSALVWGIGETVHLELGYGISDMFVIGVIAEIGGTSITAENDDDDDDNVTVSQTTVAVGPKVDLMFGSGAMRPFVGAAIALAVASQSSESGDTEIDASMVGVQLVGRGGVRWFATPNVSLDGSLALSWMTMSGDGDGPVAVENTNTALGFAALFGVSGWL